VVLPFDLTCRDRPFAVTEFLTVVPSRDRMRPNEVQRRFNRSCLDTSSCDGRQSELPERILDAGHSCHRPADLALMAGVMLERLPDNNLRHARFVTLLGPDAPAESVVRRT